MKAYTVQWVNTYHYRGVSVRRIKWQMNKYNLKTIYVYFCDFCLLQSIQTNLVKQNNLSSVKMCEEVQRMYTEVLPTIYMYGNI